MSLTNVALSVRLLTLGIALVVWCTDSAGLSCGSSNVVVAANTTNFTLADCSLSGTTIIVANTSSRSITILRSTLQSIQLSGNTALQLYLEDVTFLSADRITPLVAISGLEVSLNVTMLRAAAGGPGYGDVGPVIVASGLLGSTTILVVASRFFVGGADPFSFASVTNRSNVSLRDCIVSVSRVTSVSTVQTTTQHSVVGFGSVSGGSSVAILRSVMNVSERCYYDTSSSTLSSRGLAINSWSGGGAVTFESSQMSFAVVAEYGLTYSYYNGYNYPMRLSVNAVNISASSSVNLVVTIRGCILASFLNVSLPTAWCCLYIAPYISFVNLSSGISATLVATQNQLHSQHVVSGYPSVVQAGEELFSLSLSGSISANIASNVFDTKGSQQFQYTALALQGQASLMGTSIVVANNSFNMSSDYQSLIVVSGSISSLVDVLRVVNNTVCHSAGSLSVTLFNLGTNLVPSMSVQVTGNHFRSTAILQRNESTGDVTWSDDAAFLLSPYRSGDCGQVGVVLCGNLFASIRPTGDVSITLAGAAVTLSTNSFVSNNVVGVWSLSSLTVTWLSGGSLAGGVIRNNSCVSHSTDVTYNPIAGPVATIGSAPAVVVGNVAGAFNSTDAYALWGQFLHIGYCPTRLGLGGTVCNNTLIAIDVQSFASNVVSSAAISSVAGVVAVGNHLAVFGVNYAYVTIVSYLKVTFDSSYGGATIFGNRILAYQQGEYPPRAIPVLEPSAANACDPSAPLATVMICGNTALVVDSSQQVSASICASCTSSGSNTRVVIEWNTIELNNISSQWSSAQGQICESCIIQGGGAIAIRNNAIVGRRISFPPRIMNDYFSASIVSSMQLSSSSVEVFGNTLLSDHWGGGWDPPPPSLIAPELINACQLAVGAVCNNTVRVLLTNDSLVSVSLQLMQSALVSGGTLVMRSNAAWLNYSHSVSYQLIGSYTHQSGARFTCFSNRAVFVSVAASLSVSIGSISLSQTASATVANNTVVASSDVSMDCSPTASYLNLSATACMGNILGNSDIVVCDNSAAACTTDATSVSVWIISISESTSQQHSNVVMTGNSVTIVALSSANAYAYILQSLYLNTYSGTGTVVLVRNNTILVQGVKLAQVSIVSSLNSPGVVSNNLITTSNNSSGIVSCDAAVLSPPLPVGASICGNVLSFTNTTYNQSITQLQVSFVKYWTTSGSTWSAVARNNTGNFSDPFAGSLTVNIIMQFYGVFLQLSNNVVELVRTDDSLPSSSPRSIAAGLLYYVSLSYQTLATIVIDSNRIAVSDAFISCNVVIVRSIYAYSYGYSSLALNMTIVSNKLVIHKSRNSSLALISGGANYISDARYPSLQFSAQNNVMTVHASDIITLASICSGCNWVTSSVIAVATLNVISLKAATFMNVTLFNGGVAWRTQASTIVVSGTSNVSALAFSGHANATLVLSNLIPSFVEFSRNVINVSMFGTVDFSLIRIDSQTQASVVDNNVTFQILNTSTCNISFVAFPPVSQTAGGFSSSVAVNSNRVSVAPVNTSAWTLAAVGISLLSFASLASGANINVNNNEVTTTSLLVLDVVVLSCAFVTPSRGILISILSNGVVHFGAQEALDGSAASEAVRLLVFRCVLVVSIASPSLTIANNSLIVTLQGPSVMNISNSSFCNYGSADVVLIDVNSSVGGSSWFPVVSLNTLLCNGTRNRCSQALLSAIGHTVLSSLTDNEMIAYGVTSVAAAVINASSATHDSPLIVANNRVRMSASRFINFSVVSLSDSTSTVTVINVSVVLLSPIVRGGVVVIAGIYSPPPAAFSLCALRNDATATRIGDAGVNYDPPLECATSVFRNRVDCGPNADCSCFALLSVASTASASFVNVSLNAFDSNVSLLIIGGNNVNVSVSQNRLACSGGGGLVKLVGLRNATVDTTQQADSTLILQAGSTSCLRIELASYALPSTVLLAVHNCSLSGLTVIGGAAKGSQVVVSNSTLLVSCQTPRRSWGYVVLTNGSFSDIVVLLQSVNTSAGLSPCLSSLVLVQNASLAAVGVTAKRCTIEGAVAAFQSSLVDAVTVQIDTSSIATAQSLFAVENSIILRSQLSLASTTVQFSGNQSLVAVDGRSVVTSTTLLAASGSVVTHAAPAASPAALIAVEDGCVVSGAALLMDNSTFVGVASVVSVASGSAALTTKASLTIRSACATWNGHFGTLPAVSLHHYRLFYVPLCHSAFLNTSCACHSDASRSMSESGSNSPSGSLSVVGASRSATASGSSSPSISLSGDSPSQSAADSPSPSPDVLSVSPSHGTLTTLSHSQPTPSGTTNTLSATFERRRAPDDVVSCPVLQSSPPVVSGDALRAPASDGRSQAAFALSFSETVFRNVLWFPYGAAVPSALMQWAVVPSSNSVVRELKGFGTLVDTSRVVCIIAGVTSLNCTLPLTPSFDIAENELIKLTIGGELFALSCFEGVATATFVIAPTSQPPISEARIVASIAAVASLGTALGGAPDSQLIGVLSSMPCASGTVQQTEGLIRFLISPFYDFGNIAMLFGNIGVAVAFFAVRFLLTHIGAVSREAMRFPSLDIALAQFLVQGVVSASSALFADGDSFASKPLEGVAAVLGIVIVIAFFAVAIVTCKTVVMPTASWSQYELPTAGAVVWLLPRGFWQPRALARCYGALFSSSREGATYYIFAPPITSTLVTLIAAARPPQQLCVIQFSIIGVLLCATAVLFAWKRPYRTRLTHVFVVAFYAAMAALVLVSAIGSQRPSPSIESAKVNIGMLLSLIVVCRGVHDLGVRLYEYFVLTSRLKGVTSSKLDTVLVEGLVLAVTGLDLGPVGNISKPQGADTHSDGDDEPAAPAAVPEEPPRIPFPLWDDNDAIVNHLQATGTYAADDEIGLLPLMETSSSPDRSASSFTTLSFAEFPRDEVSLDWLRLARNSPSFGFH